MHGDSMLFDIGVAILAATTLAYVARWLRQPLLLAYIGAGVLIGPPGLDLVHADRVITELSELGLAFLLFIVGLEIDLRKLVETGKVGAVVGIVQVVACAGLATGAAALLGYRGLAAGYLGVATAFSSTMIVVKLLSDKSELDTVDGRITLGILLVQDVLAIVVLALQPNLSNPSIGPMALSLLSGMGLAGGALVAARFLLPPLFRRAAKTPELVLISAISWCLLIGYLAMLAKFSIAMGALIAGVTLSALPYRLDVGAKIGPLRDFFVTLFFVALGMQLQLGTPAILFAALAMSAVVVFSRFVTVGPLLQVFGYGPRVGVLSSLALSQAGEFSLVIVSLGLTLGHIDREVASITALTMVTTATLSTYMMTVNHQIAGGFTSLLARVGLRHRSDTPSEERGRHAEIVLLGFHRVASSLFHTVNGVGGGRPMLVVDFSPEVHQRLSDMQMPILYGDISHLDTLEHADISTAKIILSTVSDDFLRGTNNATLLEQIRRLNPGAKVIVCAETLRSARQLYAAGADYVVLPRLETAHAFVAILRAIERGELAELRAKAQADLEHRDEVMA